MRKVFLGLLVLFSALAAQGQTVNIRGKVTNASGAAVSGASVELLKRGLKATSGADGAYSIVGTVGVLHPSAAGGISLAGGVLRMHVDITTAIAVRVYDARGNLLRKESVANAAPGSYSWDFHKEALSDELMIIHASMGGERRTFRYVDVDRGLSFGAGAAGASGSSVPALAKMAADVDTLQVTAAGYDAKKVGLASYEAEQNVTLEAGSDRWGGLKNPPGKSAGCGKATTITSGPKTITSGGRSRDYTIDVPAGYDMNKAYRLFYCSHWIGSNDDAVANGSVNPGGGAANWGYYGLKRMATTAGEPAIFIAPSGLNGSWGEVDHALFDDILQMAKTGLCVDTTRVFATGFSFGGMITYSLSTAKQKKIRAAVGIAPANYNIWLPNPLPRDPIAWMSTTGAGPGSRDGTCPWDGGNNRGAKYIALQRAQDNGCTIPAGNNIPINTTAKSHLCYDFTGCKSGYPVKACTFDGGHIAAHADGGTSDHGVNSWIPTESWKFFTQF
jgi:hypothetical protein